MCAGRHSTRLATTLAPDSHRQGRDRSREVATRAVLHPKGDVDGYCVGNVGSVVAGPRQRHRLGYCDRGRSKPLEPSSSLDGCTQQRARLLGARCLWRISVTRVFRYWHRCHTTCSKVLPTAIAQESRQYVNSLGGMRPARRSGQLDGLSHPDVQHRHCVAKLSRKTSTRSRTSRPSVVLVDRQGGGHKLLDRRRRHGQSGVIFKRSGCRNPRRPNRQPANIRPSRRTLIR